MNDFMLHDDEEPNYDATNPYVIIKRLADRLESTEPLKEWEVQYLQRILNALLKGSGHLEKDLGIKTGGRGASFNKWKQAWQEEGIAFLVDMLIAKGLAKNYEEAYILLGSEDDEVHDADKQRHVRKLHVTKRTVEAYTDRSNRREKKHQK